MIILPLLVLFLIGIICYEQECLDMGFTEAVQCSKCDKLTEFTENIGNIYL